MRNFQSFPKWLQHFTFPPKMQENSGCSTSLLRFGVFRLYNFSHAIGWSGFNVTNTILISISLTTSDIEHSFMYLLAISISSSLKCLFQLLPIFKKRVFQFLILNCRSSLYILETGSIITLLPEKLQRTNSIDQNLFLPYLYLDSVLFSPLSFNTNSGSDSYFLLG